MREAEAYQQGETRRRVAEAAVSEAENRAQALAALAEAARIGADGRLDPGDVISMFAEVTDTALQPHIARSETVRLMVISVEDYNNFLREQTDLAETEAKYALLKNRVDAFWQSAIAEVS